MFWNVTFLELLMNLEKTIEMCQDLTENLWHKSTDTRERHINLSYGVRNSLWNCASSENPCKTMPDICRKKRCEQQWIMLCRKNL